MEETYECNFFGVVPPIFKYDKACELNPRLYKVLFEGLSNDIENNWDDSPDKKHDQDSEGGSFLISPRDLHLHGIKPVNILMEWISSLIPRVTHYYSSPDPIEFNYDDYLPYSDNGGGKYNFDISRFKISHCWSVFYNKGDCVELHNHFPYALSFAYYVNMPKGSSPIMIDGEVIYPEEGQVVFFPGSSFHSVPPSKVSGRCMIAGNIMYVDKY